MPQPPDLSSYPPGQAADPAHRGRLFWGVLAVLVCGQLVAFWMLCSQQVRKAQMRDLSSQVQRVAIADCLQYIPRATLNSCVSRVDPGRSDVNGVVPEGDKDSPAPAGPLPKMSGGAPSGVAYQ